MTDLASSRFALPFLAVGQAQKELTHNEALQRLDMLLHPVVQSVIAAPPGSPDIGQCWLVGAAASGGFAGRAGQVACWTGMGWRFAGPVEGMRVWDIAAMACRIFRDADWVLLTLPDNASGGSVIDVEARAMLAAMRDLLGLSGFALE